MFCRVFVDNKLSVGYINKTSYVKKILELLESMISALEQAMSRPRPFELHPYCHAFDFLGRLYANEADVYILQL